MNTYNKTGAFYPTAKKSKLIASIEIICLFEIFVMLYGFLLRTSFKYLTMGFAAPAGAICCTACIYIFRRLIHKFFKRTMTRPFRVAINAMLAGILILMFCILWSSKS